MIDLTTWDFPSPERSRLPVDRLNGTVDILLNQSGQVVHNTTYSQPVGVPDGRELLPFLDRRPVRRYRRRLGTTVSHSCRCPRAEPLRYTGTRRS